MQFYNTSSTELSLVHELWTLCDADITSMPLVVATRRMNASLEELVGDIINADGTWQYDDTNYTDHPVGTGTLVEGQEDYAFSSEYLQIEAIEVLDAGSPATYQKLRPLDRNELGNLSTEQYFGLTAAGNPQTGFPEYFDQVGDTVRLYPAPTSSSVTLASGIKIYFKRTADIFTISDTTQVPGLPSTHHILLAYMAAVPFCMAYKKDRVAWLEKKIGSNDPQSPVYGGMKKTLIDHYAHREKAKRKMIIPYLRSFR